MKKILLLAGEESGMIYANQIRSRILGDDSSVEIRGYADYGFDVADMAVFGFWEVFRHIFYFLRVKRTMERAIDEWHPDVVCTIDYPGLNLKLAAYAKSRGIRAVHVVCPQVWAWHQGRIPKIEASLDRLCCFFPFEPCIFRSGFAEFVGHPLVEAMAGETHNRDHSGKYLAILPGSRLCEIERHLPTLLKAVSVIREEIDVLRVVIPAANDRALTAIRAIVGDSKEVEVQLGGARQVLAEADCAAVASGTATFEAAMVGCPFVLVYRVSALFAAFLRFALNGVKHVGLVNIIAEKAGKDSPMPELLQENFTVSGVVGYLRKWLVDANANAEAREALSRTMQLMRSDGDAIGRIVAAMRDK